MENVTPFDPSENPGKNLTRKEEFYVWLNLAEMYKSLQYLKKARAALRREVRENEPAIDLQEVEKNNLESVAYYHSFKLADKLFRKDKRVHKKSVEELLDSIESDAAIFQPKRFHPKFQVLVVGLAYDYALQEIEDEGLTFFETGQEIDWKGYLHYIALSFKKNLSPEIRLTVEKNFTKLCIGRLLPTLVNILLEQFWNIFTHDTWSSDKRFNRPKEEMKRKTDNLKSEYLRLWNEFNVVCALKRDAITLPEAIAGATDVSAKILGAWDLLTSEVSFGLIDPVSPWKVAPYYHFDNHFIFRRSLSNYIWGQKDEKELVKDFKEGLEKDDDAINPRRLQETKEKV